MNINRIYKNSAGKKALFARLPVTILPIMVLTACSTMKNMPHNVSGWASTVARPESRMPKICTGWQKIELKNHSRYLLMQRDQKLLLNIDAHNLRGRNLGCWS